MNKLILIASVVGVFLFTACGNEEKKEDNSAVGLENPTGNVSPDVVTPEINSPPAEPMQNQPADLTVNPGVSPPAPGKTPAGMNPPHGEPGHDCAIAVGAPLNSPKNNAPSTPTEIKLDPNSQSQEITIPAGTPPGQPIQIPAPSAASPAPPGITPAPSGPTPAGMNPPHGQPGHDCAIPVGAPLKK